MTRTEFEARLPEVRQQMMRWARAKVRGGDVEDFVQEALLRVLGTLDRIEADDAVHWSIGILRNVMRHTWRDAGRASFVPLVHEETGDAVDIPVEAAQETWCEAQEALRVIASLPADRQSLFVDVRRARELPGGGCRGAGSSARHGEEPRVPHLGRRARSGGRASPAQALGHLSLCCGAG